MISRLSILGILILINAFFASAEIAFVSLNDAKISKLAKEGDKKARQIEKMLKEPSKFLATIQIGITLAGFLSSAFAADAFADQLAPLLQSTFPIGIGIWRTVSILIITIILAYFTLVLGELVPKRIAMKNYEKIAYASVGAIRAIYLFTSPFVRFLTMSTNFVCRIFGVEENEEDVITEEEIRMMIEVGKEKGTINEEEKQMINNVFEFNDKSVSEVMIHRKDIFAIDVKANISDILDEIHDYKYSRIPVYEETIDDIKGMVFAKDLLKIFYNKEKVKIENIMRPAYFVSENKRINEVFKDLQRSRNQIVIVLDEYGGTAGLITMEDIIEEIVGNIFDEYDEVEDDYEKIDDNTYIINGNMGINNLEMLLEIKIPEGDYDTLSGYLIEEIGRIPEDDEKPIIETKFATYKIEEYEDKRILKVKVCKTNPEILDEEDDGKSDKKDEEDE